ncbi:MAG: S8 family serine peptidase [Muribaculaceae bacterium]|nr:S8 family serine peptidase [Muribaculaceae bacterium]
MKNFQLSAIIAAFIISISTYTVAAAEEPDYIPTILVFENEDELAELEDEGVIIWYHRADMALAAIPKALASSGKFQSKSKSKSKKNFRLPQPAKPALDIARGYADAYKIHSGEGISQAYTGKDIVVGFCDSGFDPNHIAFRDASGKSRVKLLIDYKETSGEKIVCDTAEEIAAWTTDNPDMYHATHVANIMAGGYMGNDYWGMAPEAEIVACTSQLYDPGILASCEDIIAYAKSVGKRAVINLSLGSYNGPHDGTSLFNRYLDILGQEAVICLAAGNQATLHHTYRADFSESNPAWRTRVWSYDTQQFHVTGLTDAWSADNRPIGARILILDLEDGLVYRSPIFDETSEFPIVISSENDAVFGRYLEGEVEISGEIDKTNGRWVTNIYYDVKCDLHDSTSPWTRARYELGIEYSGAPGTHADIAADGLYSLIRQWPGYEAPGDDLSVSDLACGQNLICVGMYNNRASLPLVDGSEMATPVQPLTISNYSGYGTLIDGRVLPHTVAPGGYLVSGCNSHFLAAHPEKLSEMNHCETIEGNNYYWARDAGTSMSTPFVAGTIATWLEANPALDVEDIKNIIISTNNHNYPDSDNPRHGLGWFEPYLGLKMAVAMSGVTPGKTDAGKPMAIYKGNCIEVLNPGAINLSCSIFGIDGRLINQSVIINAPVTSFDIADLNPGAYILSITSESTSPISLKFSK